jgi:rSAM/selenodomain-associated transferase 1
MAQKLLMEKGLIIFVRNPEKGRVKSRLAKSIGDEQALKVYVHLLQYTRDVTHSVNCNHFVFYSSYVHMSDVFDDNYFSKRVQQGDDLGERMMTAFKEVFTLGCKKVCIIGSDCYELTSEIIENAFIQLESQDVVIGPSTDGGYYLLGMKELHEALFLEKEWGTSTVLEDTIDAAERLNISFKQLPLLNDIDTIEDLLDTDILARLEEENS